MEGAEVAYFGLIFVTQDSLYHFAFPFKLSLSEPYLLYGKNLILAGKIRKRIKLENDTLYAQWRGKHEYFEDTSEYINVESYVRFKYCSRDLVHLLLGNEISLQDTTRSIQEKKDLSFWRHFDLCGEWGEEYEEF